MKGNDNGNIQKDIQLAGLKVLVACEYSGTVRDAFLARGHDAVSCDLLPTDVPGPHYQGSVLDIVGEPWDLMIAHPPCTYLCNSGVRWLHTEAGRRDKMRDAAHFFVMLQRANIPKIAIENPIPHRYAKEWIGKYSQLIQPWQHGHGETKATCLWLKNLEPLKPSNVVEGREQRIFKLPPSADRWKLRSTTFPGIARAFAEQWG